MPDATAAERNRRYRRHKAGDHSMCDPARCESRANADAVEVESAGPDRDADQDVTPVTPGPAGVTRDDQAVTDDSPGPPRLDEAGAAFWSAMNGDKLAGAPRQLLVQACRSVDRLARLDAMLRGTHHEWMRLVVKLFDDDDDRDDQDVTVVARVDSILAEERQQALALKALLTELRASGAADSGGGRSALEQLGDQLAARRAARQADAASM
ncbi:hypothetical protein ACTOB_001238 [Actinoplanes oblitus]|uniref:Terminase small subunit n=1 Tax=Actinoplanes oblitus TaxID=3040509 RepID=A0ABY8WIQ5_9ACTN|nr:hypothetical protein [Actinoplanes oblitus]WIM97690.1 hypothetical protein ACTOB_001238 [Actinoplanes oblitus]